jgi:metal-responsive CopG/Arc/MetJ family transcriptional regulator
MTKITVKVSEQLADALNAAAEDLEISRSDLIHQALQCYLDDYHDLKLAAERLQDPDDRVMNWHEARNGLLDTS